MVEKARSRLAIVWEGTITLNSKNIPYIVKRSTRARHVRLEIKRETGLTAVIPRFYSIRRLHDLLKIKQAWVLRNLTAYSNVRSPSVGKEVKTGDVILYLGRELKVLTTGKSGKTDRVRLEPDRVIVCNSDKQKLNAVLEQWYRIQAAKLIKEKTEKWRARLHVSYNRLTIRGQKSRWGSCSHKGNLSFNWKLLMAPEPVIEYIIIHELTHLKEMNHSQRFWQLVAERCPRWCEHKKWLKTHESELAAGLSPRKSPFCT